MEELNTNIEAIRGELKKPEVVASLRMITPELYAHVTAVVAVYDAFLKQRYELEKQQTAMMQIKQQQYAMMAQYEKDRLDKLERTAKQVRPSMFGKIKDIL